MERRKFLKTAAGIGSLAAVPLTQGVSGFDWDYARYLLRQGEFEKFKQYMEKHNENYNIDIDRLDNSNDGPSIQDYYDKSKSYVGTVTHPKDGSNHVDVSMVWSLDRYESGYACGDFDTPAPADVAVIAWEEDIFGHVNNSTSHKTTNGYAKNKGSGDCDGLIDGKYYRDGKSDIVSTAVDQDPTNAVVAKVQDGDKLEWWEYGGSETLNAVSTTGELACTVRKQSSYTGRIATKYVHTWGLFEAGTWNIFESVSVGPKGSPVSISVDLPKGTDSWIKSADRDR